MTDVSPHTFSSVQEYLKALEFEVKDNTFVRGDISFPVNEIIGYTVNSFHEKAKRRGWLEPLGSDLPLSDWGQRFLTIMQVNFI